jgi:hypothetical protein
MKLAGFKNEPIRDEKVRTLEPCTLYDFMPVGIRLVNFRLIEQRTKLKYHHALTIKLAPLAVRHLNRI